MSRLTIEVCDGEFLVRDGDRFAVLCADEAAWVAVCWIREHAGAHPATAWMQTYAEQMAKPWHRDTPIAGLLTHQPQAVTA